MEIWIDVKDSCKYEVSSEGRVRNKKTGRILSPRLNKKGGYQCVNIEGGNKYIHHLVADAFFAGDHENSRIYHQDKDKLNNKVSNLQWRKVSKFE